MSALQQKMQQLYAKKPAITAIFGPPLLLAAGLAALSVNHYAALPEDRACMIAQRHVSSPLNLPERFFDEPARLGAKFYAMTHCTSDKLYK